MEPTEVETLFVIPDIGGYVRFMLHNKNTQTHAQNIISELMRAMIEEMQVPLKLAEVEGDAMLLYVIKESEEQWARVRHTVAFTLEHFLIAFYAKMKELMHSSICSCDTCTGVDELHIKVVVHLGMAVFDTLQQIITLNGVDAIVAHRLLKNSLRGDYILVTKSTFEACKFVEPERFKPHQEHYDDIGTVEAMVYHAHNLKRI